MQNKTTIPNNYLRAFMRLLSKLAAVEFRKKSMVFLLFTGFTGSLILARLFFCDQTLGLDEAEQIVFAQKLSAGYPAQPPLYTWLQYFVFQNFGVSLFSFVLLKYVLIFTCIYFYHLTCKIYFKDTLLCWGATLSWALIPNISYDLLPHRTHAILALLAACLTWYWFIKPSYLPKSLWYATFGLIIGVGFLSKFNYLLFLAIFFITALSIREYRQKLLQPHMVIALVCAAFLTAPYWLWLIKNSSVGFYASYKLTPPGRGLWYGIVRLLGTSLCFVIPILCAKFFFPFNWQKSSLSTPIQLLRRYHLLVLPLLLLGVVGAGVHCFKTHWVLPLLFLTPIWLFSFFDKETYSVNKAKRYLMLCVGVQTLMLCLWIGRTPFLARFPMDQLVAEIRHDQQVVDTIVSDSHWLLGSLMIRLSIDKGILIHPSKDPIIPKESKLLLVWDKDQPPSWLHKIPLMSTVSIQQPLKTLLAHQSVIAERTYRLIV